MLFHLRQAGVVRLSRIALRLCEAASARLPCSLIKRDDDAPYFFRYYLTREHDERPEDFGVFIHKFVGSDPLDEVHNHPWEWMISIILSGSYFETRYKRASIIPGSDGKPRKIILEPRGKHVRRPFDLNVILHHDLHRVELLGKDPCWTLFIHGPRISTWGFARESTGDFREITRRTKDGTNSPNPLTHGQDGVSS